MFFNKLLSKKITHISFVHLQKINLMKIFVAGLPYDLDDSELEEIFEKFGTIVSAKVAMDKETGKSKGFGFIEMQNDAEALDAIESLNDISLGKKPLVVKKAEEGNSRPGGAGGARPGSNAPRGGNNMSGGFNRDRNRY
jgi:cold-inducible RNA-binding protein